MLQIILLLTVITSGISQAAANSFTEKKKSSFMQTHPTIAAATEIAGTTCCTACPMMLGAGCANLLQQISAESSQVLQESTSSGLAGSVCMTCVFCGAPYLSKAVTECCCDGKSYESCDDLCCPELHKGNPFPAIGRAIKGPCMGLTFFALLYGIKQCPAAEAALALPAAAVGCDKGGQIVSFFAELLCLSSSAAHFAGECLASITPRGQCCGAQAQEMKED